MQCEGRKIQLTSKGLRCRMLTRVLCCCSIGPHMFRGTDVLNLQPLNLLQGGVHVFKYIQTVTDLL